MAEMKRKKEKKNDRRKLSVKPHQTFFDVLVDLPARLCWKTLTLLHLSREFVYRGFMRYFQLISL
jgi:hypothetical protein